MITATEVLEREDYMIEKIMPIMDRIMQQMNLDRDVDLEILRDLLDFMRIFCDQFHVAREESYLFPMLEKKGAPAHGCPIATLRCEHLKIHRLVEEFSDSTAAYIRDARLGSTKLRRAFQNILAFIPLHIWKEVYLLLPMAEKLLSSSDQRLLVEQFDLAEMDMGGHVSCDFEKLTENLPMRVGVCSECSHAA